MDLSTKPEPQSETTLYWRFEDGFIPIDMVRALGKVYDEGLEVATINKCIRVGET